MKVILRKDVKGIGRTGDVKEVSDGHARNFLIPGGLARLADEKSIKEIKASSERSQETAQNAIKEAKAMAAGLSGKVFTFSLPAAEKGHLYAGLKESEISARISEGKASQPENQIKIVDYSPIKTVGSHKVRLKVGSAVTEINILIHPHTK